MEVQAENEMFVLLPQSFHEKLLISEEVEEEGEKSFLPELGMTNLPRGEKIHFLGSFGHILSCFMYIFPSNSKRN